VEAFDVLVKKYVHIIKFNLILDLLISVLDCASLFVESLEIKTDNKLVGHGI
jgi:hypothetical protein